MTILVLFPKRFVTPLPFFSFFFVLSSLQNCLSLSLPLSTYYHSQLTISKNQKLKDKEGRDVGIDKIAGKARAAKLAKAVDDGVHLDLQGTPLVHQSYCLWFHIHRHHCYGCVFRSSAQSFYQRLSFEWWVWVLVSSEWEEFQKPA